MNEGKGVKDHIIRNMCSKIGKNANWNFTSSEVIWSVFMNDCTKAAFYLGEEGENQVNCDESSNSRNTDNY